MARAGQVALKFAATISLLLCLASAILWARMNETLLPYLSLFNADHHVGSHLIFYNVHGRLIFSYALHSYDAVNHDLQEAHQYRQILWAWGLNQNPRWWRQMGFTTGMGVDDATPTITFPCWAACIVTLILLAYFVGKRIRQSTRQRQGYCRNCGYDLRATPQRCPECGTEAIVATDKNQMNTDEGNVG